MSSACQQAVSVSSATDEVKRSRMLRGLGLLLPVLVLGGLLHSEVVLSWDCASFHVSWVLSGDENSPVATTDVSF